MASLFTLLAAAAILAGASGCAIESVRTVQLIDTSKYDVSTIYHDRFYLASKTVADFNLEENDKACVEQGGYLLELDDDAERDFTLEFAKRIGGATLFAMGGNDIKLEGQWVYTHSKKLVPSSVTWLPGEPNNSGGEDCMAFWIDMNGINDIRCYNNPAKYICEIPLRP